MSELVEIFREEVDSNLKAATRLVLELESGADERAQTEALMRVFHTIKGAARAIGFEQEKTTAHLLEDVYHDLLEGRAEPRPDLADLSLAAIDLIRNTVIARLEEQPVPALAPFEARVAAYRAGEPPPPAASTPQPTPEQPTTVTRPPESEPGPAAGAAQPAPAPDPIGIDGLDLMAIFRTEAEGHIETARALLADAAGTGELRRTFHTLKGAARAIGCDPIREVAAAIEDLFHGLDDAAGAPASAVAAAGCALGWVEVILSDLLDGRAAPDSQALLAHLKRVPQGGSPGDCPPAPGTSAATGQVDHTRPIPEPMPTGDAAPHAATPHGPSANVPSGDAAGYGDALFDFIEVPEQHRAPLRPKAPEPQARPPVGERRRTGDGHAAHGRTSVAYQQLDRLQRLSGELTVAVGALNAQRGEIIGLARSLNRTSQLLQRLVTEGGEREGLAEAVRTRLEQLGEVGSGLEALAEGHDRVDGRLQHLVDRLSEEVTQARLVPLSDLLDDYPRMVRDLGRELGKQVSLQVQGAENSIDRAVLEQLRNPLLHLVRNAIDHGIEAPGPREQAGKPAAGRLYIEARQLGSMMRIRVADDGTGIDQERLMRTVVDGGHTTAELWQAMNLEERMQFLFLPGLSTTDEVSTTSGRGFGLDIVKSLIDGAGGQVAVHSEAGRGTVFELRMPLSLSLTRCLLLVGGKHPLFGTQRYALPMNEVLRVHRLETERLREVQGRMAVRVDDATLPIYHLDALLGLTPLHRDMAHKHLILIGDADGRFGLVVDEVSDELNLVSRPLDERLGKVREIAALALLDDGGMALILDVPDLLEHMRDAPGWSSVPGGVVGPASGANGELSLAAQLGGEGAAAPPHLLVVEDSATVREVERHFLEQAGYRVSMAVNGMDGLNKARGGDFAMLITDIDMPRMNGIELISTLRGMDRFRGLPIVVVSYKDRAEDREKALEAGADRYVTKSQFDTDVMLGMVAELLAQH